MAQKGEMDKKHDLAAGKETGTKILFFQDKS